MVATRIPLGFVTMVVSMQLLRRGKDRLAFIRFFTK
jgi:hypothetical protein